MLSLERASLRPATAWRPLAPLPAAWECDLSDDRLTWSPGVYDLFGIAPGTPLDRRDIVAMYCAESRIALERVRALALERQQSFTFEAEIRRADGAHRLIMLSADVICHKGRVTHLYGTKQDITPASPGAAAG